MKTSNIRTVHFMEVQGAEDLYRCHENGKVYIRQQCDNDHVRWLTSIKWSGGYEADCPMKEGLTIRVISSDETVLFEEKLIQEEGYSGTVAVKAGPFSYEAIKVIAETVPEIVEFRPWQDWKAWMLKTAKKYGYTGYDENWLWAEVKYEKPMVLKKVDYLGKTAYITSEKCTHRISGDTWNCIEIRDVSNTTLWVVGYVFEEVEVCE